MYNTVLIIVVLISNGVFVGGLIMAAAAIMPTFRMASATVYIWMHQTIDPYIERYMPFTAGFTVLAGSSLFFLSTGTLVRVLVAAGVLCTATVSAISQFGNVPINKLVKSWRPDAPPPSGEISHLQKRWSRFHLARITFAMLAMLAFINAAVMR